MAAEGRRVKGVGAEARPFPGQNGLTGSTENIRPVVAYAKSYHPKSQLLFLWDSLVCGYPF